MKNSCTIQITQNSTSEQSLFNRQNINRFVIGGEEDYFLSRILHQVSLHDSGMYHYQQCMEKFMKAFLIEKNTQFDLTHDLNILRKLCSNYDPFFNDPDVIHACKEVTPFEVLGRYPSTIAWSHGWIIPDLIYFLDEFVFEMMKRINRSGFFDTINEMKNSGEINPLPRVVRSTYFVELFFLNNQFFSKK